MREGGFINDCRELKVMIAKSVECVESSEDFK